MISEYIVREADKTRRCTGVIVHRCRNIRDPQPGRKALRSEQGNGLQVTAALLSTYHTIRRWLGKTGRISFKKRVITFTKIIRKMQYTFYILFTIHCRIDCNATVCGPYGKAVPTLLQNRLWIIRKFF